MALWTSSYPVDAGDRDPSFAWHDTDVPSAGLDETQHDLFAQFLDFEAGHGPAGAGEPSYQDAMQHQHHQNHHLQQQESSTASSGVSNADDFDFLSSGSNPAAGYEVDPSALAMFAQDPSAMYTSTAVTVSDTELERLEGISLHSPKKESVGSADRVPSPTPDQGAAVLATTTAALTTTGRRSKKIVEALSSTLRKATMRKTTTRKASQALQRAVSPSLENPPMAIKPNGGVPRGRRAHRAHTQHAALQSQQQQQFSHSPPLPLQIDTGLANGAGFVAGQFDDPFGGDISPTHAPPQQQQQQQQQQQMRYYSQGGIGTPMDSPTRAAAMLQQQQSVQHWQHQMHQQQQNGGAQWSTTRSQQELWWGGAAGPVDAKNIDANMAMHSQHGELPYDVHADGHMAAAAQNGLMIHMPQPRAGTGVNELALNAHTYLPPPVPPIPADNGRSVRPPRAPSSGARHHNRTMSSSPMRKQRAPSASPSPGTRQSRHSSGASAASSAQRSVSGRVVSVPGTPSGVKKRRSRDAGSGSFSADDGGGILLGGGGGGGGIGFVNFTPNDGSVLMTGVAPSGSSKTKARREKEAQDRRRRLSEAAMKAVAAAGGDIEKLREQGFEL